MAKFYILNTFPCYVTEVVEVEAADTREAEQRYMDGDRTMYVGHALGDVIDWAGGDTCEALPAEPHNLPECMFYPESAESTCAEVKAAHAADGAPLAGNASIPHPNTDECTAACNNAVPDDDWSGSLDPSDPDNFWIDDATGERVNAHTGERSKVQS